MAGLTNAVLDNRLKQVSLLLKLGGDVNSRSPCGETLLMSTTKMATENAGLRMTKILLKHGANVSLSDNRNRNVLMHAVLKDRLAILECITEKCREINLNATDNDKNTALHLAAGKGKLHLVKALVMALRKYRLSLSIRNSLGRTPLMEAIVNNNTAVVIYLQEVLGSKNVPKECFGNADIHRNACFSKIRDIEINPVISLQSNLRQMGKMNSARLSGQRRSKTVSMPLNTDKTPLDNGIEWHMFGRTRPESSVSSSIYPADNSEGFTLPKLYEIWQGQLSPSYKPAAIPIYEEPVREEIPHSISSLIQEHQMLTFGTHFDIAVPISVSPLQRCRSSIEMGYVARQAQGNRKSINTVVAEFRARTATVPGRPGTNIHYPAGLQLPMTRRSRSVSPRPLIGELPS